MRCNCWPNVVLALIALFGLLAGACSSDGGDADGGSSPDSSAPTSSPDALAFEDPVESQPLRIAVPRLSFVAPADLDEVDTVEVMVTDLLTDGLTARNANSGFAEPALADSWSVSDDLLTWTFTLGDHEFESGEAITADDVVASLNAVAAKGIESLSGPNLAVVDGYDQVAAGDDDEIRGLVAVDDSIVMMTLTQPYMPLPELLSSVSFGVYPADAGTASPDVPVSSSTRFDVEELTDGSLRLVAKDQTDPFSSIELIVDPNGDLVSTGGAEIAVGFDGTSAADGVRVSVSQRSADAFFAMNHNVEPFTDVTVRAAIVQAVDRVALRNEFFPLAGVMESFIPQDVAGGSADACAEVCEMDVAAARDAVEASDVGDAEFTVDFFADADGEDDFEQRLAEAVVSDLRAVGLNATAQRRDPDEYGSLIANGELGLFRFGSVTTALTADADIAAMFATFGHDNVTGTAINEFDRKITRARTLERDEGRARTYGEAEALLFDNAVVLPLIEFRHSVILGDSIRTATLAPDGSLDLGSVRFEQR